MPKQALVPINNLQHNVPALLERARQSLPALARVYFLTEVAGQARATIEAKKRDLERFLAFCQQLYGHDRPGEWYRSVTWEFLVKPFPQLRAVHRPRLQECPHQGRTDPGLCARVGTGVGGARGVAGNTR